MSDRAGEASFEFPIPDVAGVSATLHLKGLLRSGHGVCVENTLDSEFEALTQAYISLEKDKSLYQPGQTVHLRALVFDGRSRAATNVPLTLTIIDSDGKKVLAEALTTNRFGIAAYDWKLSDQTETGNYSVQLEASDNAELDGKGEMTVPVERYDLPEFTVNAVLDRGYYLEGQTPEVKIHAGYLFGKPVTRVQFDWCRIKTIPGFERRISPTGCGPEERGPALTTKAMLSFIQTCGESLRFSRMRAISAITI